jgi:hypothetical protein
MSIAERLFTGGFSAVFSGVAGGAGYATEQCIKGVFDDAAQAGTTTGDVILDTALAVCVAGATLLAAAGAVWWGKQTIHPDF